jgi:hypothetical protein
MFVGLKEVLGTSPVHSSPCAELPDKVHSRRQKVNIEAWERDLSMTSRGDRQCVRDWLKVCFTPGPRCALDVILTFCYSSKHRRVQRPCDVLLHWKVISCGPGNAGGKSNGQSSSTSLTAIPAPAPAAPSTSILTKVSQPFSKLRRFPLLSPFSYSGWYKVMVASVCDLPATYSSRALLAHYNDKKNIDIVCSHVYMV